MSICPWSACPSVSDSGIPRLDISQSRFPNRWIVKTVPELELGIPNRNSKLESRKFRINRMPVRSFPDFRPSVAKMATCDECCGFNLKDVESYVKKHDIHYILKDCIIKLCSSRPDNPYRFMREYFENLEKVRRTIYTAELSLNEPLA